MSFCAWQKFQSTMENVAGRDLLVAGEDRISGNDALFRALRWAGSFDVDPGDRVVIVAANSVEVACIVPGIWALGAIPVFVNSDAPLSHVSHAVELTEARLILTDVDFPDGAFSTQIIDTRKDVPESEFACDPGVVDPELPASIVFTSGSTGKPKGVVQSAVNLIDGVSRVSACLGYRSGDSILCPVPFSFDYGWGQLLSALFGGYKLVLPTPANGFGACDSIERHRPEILAGVPAFFSDLCRGLAPIADTDRSSVRLITNTGSKIPGPVLERLRELFPDAAISLNYGLTETYRSASLPVGEATMFPDSVGYPLPGADIRILAEDGAEAETGAVGEIIHRGAGVFLGYWGEQSRTKEVLRPDPFGDALPAVFTGDLGYFDTGGRLYIVGRRDRQMKSMGVRVSPDDIENILMASGIITEAAVVSRPDDTLGEMVVAFVVTGENAEHRKVLRGLKQHARATMSRYMQPREWHVVSALPRNPNGKTDYPELSRLARGVASGSTEVATA